MQTTPNATGLADCLYKIVTMAHHCNHCPHQPTINVTLCRQHPMLLDWLDRAGHMYEPEDRGAWGDQAKFSWCWWWLDGNHDDYDYANAVDDSCSSGLLCRGAWVTRGKGGRQVSSKTCLCLSFNKRFKNFFFRKDDLSVLESGECQSLIQVCFITAD